MRIDLNMNRELQNIFTETTHVSEFPLISGISIDSRTCGDNDLYIALSGEHADGHDFLSQARENGARTSLVERIMPEIDGMTQIIVNDVLSTIVKIARKWRVRFNIPVIGITGSNGKTSTKDLLSHILSKKYSVHATTGNFNTTISLPLTILGLDQNHDVSVLEMGASKPGEIQYLCQISGPTLGLITNIAPAHIEGFGSLETIKIEKGALFQALGHGTSFINNDDDHIVDIPVPGKGISFGTAEHSDYRYQITFEEGSYRLELNGEKLNLGSTNMSFVRNCMAASTISLYMGLTLDQIQDAILSAKIPEGRCQVRQAGPFTVIDDTYNANLYSSLAAIDYLIRYPGDKRKILIFGDMKELGEKTIEHHRRVGEYAAECGVNGLLTVGTDTRYTAEAGTRIPVCRHFNNQQDLLNMLGNILEPNDLILVKGSRSMAMENLIEVLEKL